MTVSGSVAVLAAVISLTDIISPFVEPGSREARRARDHYRNQEWVEAIEALQAAAEEQADPVLDYNLGAASYKGQNYPEAMKSYSQALASGEIDPGRVAYDQGNVLYRSDELQAALESYRTALRANPDDEDARFNYELTLRQLKEGEDQDQEQQSGEQGDNEQQQQDSGAPRDSTGQSQPQQGDQEQGEGQEQPEQQQEGEPGEDQRQGSGGEDGQQTPEDGGAARPQQGQLLSPEEAKRLLNAITPEERELIQARLRSSQRRKVEKDW